MTAGRKKEEIDFFTLPQSLPSREGREKGNDN